MPKKVVKMSDKMWQYYIITSKSCWAAMVWNKEMNKIMLQEMVTEGSLHHKLKSRGREITWQRVVVMVNANAKLRGKCKVCKRSI